MVTGSQTLGTGSSRAGAAHEQHPRVNRGIENGTVQGLPHQITYFARVGFGNLGAALLGNRVMALQLNVHQTNAVAAAATKFTQFCEPRNVSNMPSAKLGSLPPWDTKKTVVESAVRTNLT